MTPEKFYECRPNFESKNGHEWFNTYHFLFLDENKKLSNFSENEIIFELEIKNHNKVK